MNSNGARIAFFLPSLAGGGAERITLNLLQAMADRGIELDLLLASRSGAYADAVPEQVRVIDFGSGQVWKSIPRLIAYLIRERPIALISHICHSNLAAIVARAVAGGPTRIIAVEHNSLEKNVDERLKTRFLPTLMRWLYPAADRVVGVSEGVSRDVREGLGLAENKVVTIFNPVVNDRIPRLAKEDPSHPWLTEKTPVLAGMGRLVDQKDFPTLLRAFGMVRKKRTARLILFGDGPQRDSLERLALELDIASDVDLPGFVPNPYACLSRAAALVLSSKWEGLPTVLIEAMACGCPVVSTDCPMGPDEILEGGTFGPLVPVGDPCRLAEAILEVLDHPVPAEILQARANRFSFDQSADHYLRLCGVS